MATSKHRVRLSNGDLAFLAAFLERERDKLSGEIQILKESAEEMEGYLDAMKWEIRRGNSILVLQYKRLKGIPHDYRLEAMRIRSYVKALEAVVKRLKAVSDKAGRRAGVTSLKDYYLKLALEDMNGEPVKT
jgi:hypothetical protein